MDFFYDLGSPYAWLTAERVPPQTRWVPVLLGGIFRATGRSSWAETKTRAEGMAEIARRARERGLPEPTWPQPWPDNGLTAMRAAVAAHEPGEEDRLRGNTDEAIAAGVFGIPSARLPGGEIVWGDDRIPA